MRPNDMEFLLRNLLRPEASPLDPPSAEDWQRIECHIGCSFGTDFQTFIGLMSAYQFPGEILNVSTGRTNGNDSIRLTYDCEIEASGWNPDMIPFFAIGNGDYFCFDRREEPASRVYYYYHERASYEPYSESFGEWLKNLPDFLT